MATIQVRDIPEDAYEAIVRKANSSGQSIQQYMRQHVIDFAFTPTNAELRLAVEANLAKYGSLATTDEIIAAIDEGRR